MSDETLKIAKVDTFKIVICICPHCNETIEIDPSQCDTEYDCDTCGETFIIGSFNG